MKTKLRARAYCPCNFRYMGCYQLTNCYYKLMKVMRFKGCDMPWMGGPRKTVKRAR